MNHVDRMQTSSNRLIPILLLTLLAPNASADHDPAAPAAFVAADPLYRIEHDPWSGGTWIAGGGLIFHSDGGGFTYTGVHDGLPIDKVHDLMPTPDAVWVNTVMGPAVMDKSDGSFHRIRTGDGNLFLHEGRSIYAEEAATWVGTNTKGLFRVDPVSLVATPVPNPINGSRFEHQIMDITADGPLLFISVTGYGLVEWDRSTGEARHFDVAFLQERPIYGRLLLSSSRAWIATSGDGVVVDRATGGSIEYTGPYTVNAMNIYGLARLGGEYWFATDAGVSRYNTQTDSWQYWQGMPWGSAADVAVVDGAVYAVTNRGYVIRYDRASDGWVDAHWWGSHQVLPFNTVFGCTTDGGDLIVTTGGGGALRYSASSRAWESVGDSKDWTARPLDILVWDVAVLPETLWFASHKGISLLDRVSGTWDHVRTDDRPVGHIVDNPVRDIHVDADGAWAATTGHKILRGPEKGEWQPGNVAHWDAKRNAWTRYDQSNGLAGDSVLSLDVADGRIWVGLEAGGVDVIGAATGDVRHVWSPADDKVQVLSLAARPDAVWVGTTHGLYRIDPATLEAARVAGLTELVVSSLLWDDGRLWLGAVFGGVHRYDPVSGQVESFRTGGVADASGLCLVRSGGLLYVGTQWGVDRLDVEQGTWLSKDGSVTGPSVRPTLLISEPVADGVYAPGDTVTLQGTARTPAGAWVEVGVAGTWVRASGTSSWSARFPVDEAFSGPLTLSARVFDGQRTFAQDAVRVMVRDDAGGSAATPPDFTHEPVLQAERGSTVPLVVGFEPPDVDVTGYVEVRLPGSTQTTTVPLRPTSQGVLSGESPIFTEAGEATYSIHLQWNGGQARLPALYGGSNAYKVVVQEATGRPIAFLTLVRCDAGIAPGETGEVTFGVQNTGTRAGLMRVDLAGPAFAWITEAPEPFTVPPAQTHFVRVPLSVPEGTPFGPHDLYIGAGPVERTEGSVHVTTCGVVVGEAEGGETLDAQGDPPEVRGQRSGSRGVPHPGILFGLVALAVAWTRRT